MLSKELQSLVDVPWAMGKPGDLCPFPLSLL